MNLEHRRKGDITCLVAALVALAERAKRTMDAGVPPAEFAKLEELGEAILLARKLLRLQRRT